MMSGTSVDGLDLALVDFQQATDGKWDYRILKTEAVDYSPEQTQKLKASIHLAAPDLYHLDFLYGQWLGEQVLAFCKKHKVQPDYVSSHGHTVFHEPERNFTVQIGDGQVIAQVCGIPTIYDFRSLDVQLGGQGAPLVPVGDRDLLNVYDFCLNLGGIANVSMEYRGKRIAYDIGPANMLLNYICQDLNIPYDKGGRIAQEGHLIPEML
ncbi:MAG: anhydro-N-acetylmuramic acid kinase, partial [Bacteroidota bacterium]